MQYFVACISCDQSNSHNGRNLVRFVVFWWCTEICMMNVPCSLIQKLMVYEFKLDHDATEATKNIWCSKDESTVNDSTVTRWFKKFCFYYKNNMDSEIMLRVIKTNLVSKTLRVSGELSIAQSSMIYNLHKPWQKYLELLNCQILPKYCKSFDSSISKGSYKYKIIFASY